MDRKNNMVDETIKHSPDTKLGWEIPRGVSTSRNILSNVFGNVVGTLVTLILTPILIHNLGDFQYGIWALTLSTMGSYGLLDAGMRLTLQRFVARLTGKKEREALNEVLVTVMVLMVVLSLLLCCLTAILIFILPNFFHVALSSRSLFRWLIGLMGLSVAIDLPIRAFNTYLTGLQRFDLSNLGFIITTLLRAVLILGALRLGYGLLGVACAALGIELVSVPIYRILVYWADPHASLDWRHLSRSRMREMTGFSFFAYLSNAGDYLRYYTDSAVISRILTVALVTPFSVAGRLMDNFRGFIALFTSPLLPRMSQLEGQGRTSELTEFFLRTTKVTAIVSLYIASLAFLDGKSLLRVWIGERIVSSYWLLAVLTIGYLVALVQMPSPSLMYAKGRHRVLGWWTIGEGIANLILSIVWARRYGLMGVALGTAVPMLVTGLFIQPLYVCHLLKMPIRQYIQKSFARPLFAWAIFFTFAMFAFAGQTQSSIVPFGLIVLAQSALYAILSYAIALTAEEQRETLQRCLRAARSLGRFRLNAA